MWPEKELNKLEKKIISKGIDQGWGFNQQKKFQKEKYNALITLIEKGDFGTYITEKNKLTFTLEFDKLTKKTTKKFWENNFPEFSKIDKTNTQLRKTIKQIIENCLIILRNEKQSVKKSLEFLDKKIEEVFTINYQKKQIPLFKYDFNSDTDKIIYYKKNIDEIKVWIENINKLVKVHEKL